MRSMVDEQVAHRHAGRAREEIEDDRRHERAAEHDRRGNGKLAFALSMGAGGRHLRLVDLAQNPLAVREEPQAGIGSGGGCALRSAAAGADPLLQHRHRARHRRR
jgi:hypothetical protein